MSCLQKELAKSNLKKKKNSFFLFTRCSLLHYISFIIFSLSLSIFLFSFTLVHTVLQECTVLFSSTPNGRMAFSFISSPFSSFLPSTLFTLNHSKCKLTCLYFCKDEFNSFYWKASPASSIYFVGLLPNFQLANYV